MSAAVREVEIGNRTLRVLEDDAAKEGKCYTGSWIWDCSLVLAHWLNNIAATGAPEEEEESNNKEKAPRVSERLGLRKEGFKGKKVVELGAGTGLPGLVAAVLGAQEVILTDRAGLLPGLRRNVEENGLERQVKVRELEWGVTDCAEVVPDGGVDFVLCSDIMYDVEAMPRLAKTMVELCGKETEILIAYELRIGTTECFKVLKEHGFEWTWVPKEEQDPHWQSEDIGLFILTKP